MAEREAGAHDRLGRDEFDTKPLARHRLRGHPFMGFKALPTLAIWLLNSPYLRAFRGNVASYTPIKAKWARKTRGAICQTKTE